MCYTSRMDHETAKAILVPLGVALALPYYRSFQEALDRVLLAACLGGNGFREQESQLWRQGLPDCLRKRLHGLKAGAWRHFLGWGEGGHA